MQFYLIYPGSGQDLCDRVIIRSLNGDNISADSIFQVLRTIKCNDSPMIDDCNPVAEPVCLFHIMGGKNDRDVLFFT